MNEGLLIHHNGAGQAVLERDNVNGKHPITRVTEKKDKMSVSSPDGGEAMTNEQKPIDDAKRNSLLNLIEEIGYVEVAELIIGRASPDDCARIMSMALAAQSRELSEKQIESLWGREKWSERKNRFEKPPAFIQRVYEDLIGVGLIQADFRRKHPVTGRMLDEPLYQALMNWLQNNALPFDLPAKKARTKREAAVVFRQTGDAVLNSEMVRKNLARNRRIARVAGLPGN